MRTISRKYIVLIWLWVVCATTLISQDAHFSQAFASPIHQNPALTGLYDGDVKAGIHFRQQWASILRSHSFKTYAFGAEKKFYGPGNDYFNFGLQLYHDEAGTSNFERNDVQLAFSYQRLMTQTQNADHYFSLGASLGAGQIRMDNGNLWFSRQYNPNEVSVNIGGDNGEPFLDSELQTDIFIDISMGGVYYLIGKSNVVYVGAAYFHANRPSIALTTTSTESLFSRLSIQAGGEFKLKEELSVLPTFTFWGQGPYFEYTFGGTLKYQNSDWHDVALRLGPSLRTVNRIDGTAIDAIILQGQLEMDRWSFGLSYDVNVSGLTEATRSKGAAEFSLIYTVPSGDRRPKVTCPKF